MDGDVKYNFPGFKNNYSKGFLLVLVGVFLGLFFTFFPYSWLLSGFIISIGIIIFIFVSDKKERRFLINLFLWSLILRLAIIIGISIIAKQNNGWIFGDERGIDTYALQIKESIEEVGYPAVWVGPKIFEVPMRVPVDLSNYYSISGYTYWVSTLYFLFGHNVLLPKVINAILGGSLGIFAYFIANEIYHRKVARLSAILVSFFPSLILWSVLNLKDIAFIFLTLVIIWLFIKFIKGPLINRYLFFLVIALILQWTIRTKIIPSLILSLAVSYFILLKKPIRNIFFIAIFAVFIVLFIMKPFYIIAAIHKMIGRLISYHIGHVHTEGISYKLLPDQYYSGHFSLEQVPVTVFIRMLLLSWFYFIFVPLPGQPHNFFQIISIPQMFVWYILFIFTLLGIVTSLRHKIKFSYILISHILILGSNIAIVSGNIGTTFRHRDIFTPLLLIFSAFAIVNLFGKKYPVRR